MIRRDRIGAVMDRRGWQLAFLQPKAIANTVRVVWGLPIFQELVVWVKHGRAP